MGGADRTESRRRPSLSLIASLQAEKNPNAVGGNEDDGSRRRRPASRRQQPLSNSFTSSKQNVIDNRSGDSAAGHGKKGGLFQFRRRTMLDEHVSRCALITRILCSFILPCLMHYDTKFANR